MPKERYCLLLQILVSAAVPEIAMRTWCSTEQIYEVLPVDTFPLMGSVRLRKVSVSGGLTVLTCLGDLVSASVSILYFTSEDLVSAAVSKMSSSGNLVMQCHSIAESMLLVFHAASKRSTPHSSALECR